MVRDPYFLFVNLNLRMDIYLIINSSKSKVHCTGIYIMVRTSGQCPSVPYFGHFLPNVKWPLGIKIKYFENNKWMIM